MFVSDLDRTIIFSKRYIDTVKDSTKESDMVKVEETARTISYSHKRLLKKLKESEIEATKGNRRALKFVPCTSRSKEEYTRINLGFKPEYAIIENGCRILHNEVEMAEYNEYVKETLGIDLLNFADKALEKVQKALQGMGNIRIKVVNNCYVLVIADKKDEILAQKCKDRIEKGFIGSEDNHYRILQDKSKVYVTSSAVNKATAAKWLADTLGKEIKLAAGDSAMDEVMLNAARNAIIPQHGTLNRDNIRVPGKIYLTGRSLRGSEEIANIMVYAR